jgi:hypothetical protein
MPRDALLAGEHALTVADETLFRMIHTATYLKALLAPLH